MQRDRPKWPLYVKKTMLSAKKNRPFLPGMSNPPSLSRPTDRHLLLIYDGGFPGTRKAVQRSSTTVELCECHPHYTQPKAHISSVRWREEGGGKREVSWLTGRGKYIKGARWSPKLIRDCWYSVATTGHQIQRFFFKQGNSKKGQHAVQIIRKFD